MGPPVGVAPSSSPGPQRGGARGSAGSPWRWAALVGSMWLLGCSGNSYNFAIYSARLKAVLQLSQGQLATLGVAKDTGDNVGVLAGLLGDILPPWAVICIGLAMNMAGYLSLGFILNGSIRASVWQVWLLLCLATNGSNFFITAGLVTSEKNFPHSSGAVAGLVVGFIGLSGAVFSQLYHTFIAPDTAGFLVLCALAPALVAAAACFIVTPVPPPAWAPASAAEEHRRLRLILGCCLGLAGFLLLAVLAQDFFPSSPYLPAACTCGMLLLLLLPFAPAILPLTSANEPEPPAHAVPPSSRSTPRSALRSSHILSHSSKLMHVVRPSATQYVAQCRSMSRAMQREGDAEEPASNARGGAASPCDAPPDHGPSSLAEPLLSRPQGQQAQQGQQGQTLALGQEHSFSQAACTWDFWLLFLGLVAGLGCGLTAISNLAQIGESLGYKADMQLFTSLLSIWQFLGRLICGSVSEQLAQQYAFPRPLALAAIQALMLVGLLAIALAVPGALYLGSLFIGFTYGGLCAVMPVVVRELFGLASLGLLYNTFLIAAPTGSFFLSSILVGYLYQWEAEHMHAASPVGADALALQQPQGGAFSEALLRHDANKGVQCSGPQCFRLIFLILSAVCLCGSMAYIILGTRSAALYKKLKAEADQT